MTSTVTRVSMVLYSSAKSADQVEQLSSVRTYSPDGEVDVNIAVTEKAIPAPTVATAPARFGG